MTDIKIQRHIEMIYTAAFQTFSATAEKTICNDALPEVDVYIYRLIRS